MSTNNRSQVENGVQMLWHTDIGIGKKVVVSAMFNPLDLGSVCFDFGYMRSNRSRNGGQHFVAHDRYEDFAEPHMNRIAQEFADRLEKFMNEQSERIIKATERQNANPMLKMLGGALKSLVGKGPAIKPGSIKPTGQVERVANPKQGAASTW